MNWQFLSTGNSTSPSGKLDTTDWKKMGWGFLYGLIGVLLTYATDWVAENVTGENLGAIAPILVAVYSYVAALIRKWLADNTGGTRSDQIRN